MEELERPRLLRSQDRLIAGVASGLAGHLRIPVWFVRVAFILLAAAAGIGAALYAAFWLFVPQADDDQVPPPPASLHDPTTRRRTWQLVLGALVALVLTASTGFAGVDWGGAGLPILITVVGLAFIWRSADDSERNRWAAGKNRWSPLVSMATTRNRRAMLIRSLIGFFLVVGGLGSVAAEKGGLRTLQNGLASAAFILIGACLIAAPWVMSLWTSMSREHSARIREEQKAEFAAHLHDSVLQTLALIQKQSSNSREVSRLARKQERELREWLYGFAGKAQESFAAAIKEAAADVEDRYGIKVDTVVVGDFAVTDQVEAVVHAAREALTNAAKHAGVESVSVYAEAEPEQVSVFVRDRGKGFDPGTVPTDRHGVADSIVERVARYGGAAEVRSAPGRGTEIRIMMPLLERESA